MDALANGEARLLRVSAPSGTAIGTSPPVPASTRGFEKDVSFDFNRIKGAGLLLQEADKKPNLETGVLGIELDEEYALAVYAVDADGERSKRYGVPALALQEHFNDGTHPDVPLKLCGEHPLVKVAEVPLVAGYEKVVQAGLEEVEGGIFEKGPEPEQWRKLRKRVLSYPKHFVPRLLRVTRNERGSYTVALRAKMVGIFQEDQRAGASASFEFRGEEAKEETETWTRKLKNKKLTFISSFSLFIIAGPRTN
jgi:hypothetical protein